MDNRIPDTKIPEESYAEYQLALHLLAKFRLSNGLQDHNRRVLDQAHKKLASIHVHKKRPHQYRLAEKEWGKGHSHNSLKVQVDQ